MIRRFAVALAIAGAALALLAAAATAATRFDPRDFSHSTTIDNRWFPLVPGTQFVYTGAVGRAKRIPRREVFTVTDLTKNVGGVRTRVVWDLDYAGGELVEAELIFLAQDDRRNVWLVGEYPEEYEHGKFVEAPTWLQGLAGARAGVLVAANPRLGMHPYPQGYAPPPINWTDHAKTYKRGQRVCVPAGCYRDVLVAAEFNPDEPGAYQLKYYAPRVGQVRVGWLGRDPDHEVLSLVKLTRLDGSELAAARAGALKLERHAYRVSKNVYGRTSPSTRLPGAAR
jgi:hypothetical protein